MAKTIMINVHIPPRTAEPVVVVGVPGDWSIDLYPDEARELARLLLEQTEPEAIAHTGAYRHTEAQLTVK